MIPSKYLSPLSGDNVGSIVNIDITESTHSVDKLLFMLVITQFELSNISVLAYPYLSW